MTRTTVVGIAGMAKNTGKTTATQALIDVAEARGLRLGLTSIGYDGEARDNVTGLPKPRISVGGGTVIATAKSCLNAGSARVIPTGETQVDTPLGRVNVGIVDASGTVVLAGPHTARELEIVTRLLSDLGSQLIIVDGAINRMMPMSCTDGVILATGAARCQDISRLAEETAAIARLFELPQVNGLSADSHLAASYPLEPLGGIRLLADHSLRRTLDGSSLLTEASVAALTSVIGADVDTIIVPGQASTRSLEQLAHNLGSRVEGLSLVLTDALKLVLAGEPLTTVRVLEQIERQGGRIAFWRTIPLLAVTVNPFYPSWRYEREDYEPAYVDAEELWKAVHAAVRVPVIDVKRHGGERLLSTVLESVEGARAGEAAGEGP